MIRRFLSLLALLSAASAQAQTLPLGALQEQDLRLAVIAERMMIANAPLCRQTMPITGITLHSFDQYDASLRPQLFPDGPLMIALVTPGSPAAAAGLQAGDVVRAIGAEAIADLPVAEEGHLREQAFDLLARQLSDQPISIRIERNRSMKDIAFSAPPGCRALVEILGSEALMGQSDGRVIQITYGLATKLDDEGLAVIFAHELAHSVLLHRTRLEAAGVEKGLLGEFGRSRQLNRQVEIEADRMSAHLLINAGYDPAIAPAYWTSPSARRAGGLLNFSFVYPTNRSRSALIAEEIASYLPQGISWSGAEHLLALRDQPFTQ